MGSNYHDDTAAPALSLIVPDFFSAEDTHDALAIVTEEIHSPVVDRGIRTLLASAELQQPIHLLIEAAGDVALGILGNAGWAAIVAICRRLAERFPGREVSFNLYAQNDTGRAEEYFLHDASDAALRDVSRDLARGVPGTRVAYDVDDGWLTWDESQAKKRREPARE